MQSVQTVSASSSSGLGPAAHLNKPTPGDWAMLAVFIPFSVWVLWTSWQWRKEYKRYQQHRALDL